MSRLTLTARPGLHTAPHRDISAGAARAGAAEDRR